MNIVNSLICRIRGHDGECIKTFYAAEQVTLHGHFCHRCRKYKNFPDVPWGPELKEALRNLNETRRETPNNRGLLN